MLHERIADFANVGHDHVQQSLGDTGFFKDFRDQRSTHYGCVVVRFQHYTVAACQSRGNRPHTQIEREIEGTDYSHYAGGNPVHPVFLAVHRRGKNFARHAQRISRSFLKEAFHQHDLNECLEMRAA